MAQSPTYTAGPVERAGFTDVFDTGMLIRWISVRARPMATGAARAFDARLVTPRMTTRNMAVSTASATNTDIASYPPGEWSANPLAAKPLASRLNPSTPLAITARSPAPQKAPTTCASTYGATVAASTSARPQPDRHRRVEVAAADVAERVGAGEHGEAEGQRHPHEPDAQVRVGQKLAASTALPHPPRTSHIVPMSSATRTLVDGSCTPRLDPPDGESLPPGAGVGGCPARGRRRG